MNQSKYYIELDVTQLNLLRNCVRLYLRECVKEKDVSEFESALFLHEGLLGFYGCTHSQEDVDKQVKESKIYKVLERAGYFDYEEDYHNATFYDLVKFMEDKEVLEKMLEFWDDEEKQDSN